MGRVAVARDARVDRGEVIVAGELERAAGEIDEGLHVGPGLIRLVEEVAQRFAHALLVEVARADDVEARRLQHLGDEAGVIGRGRQRRVGIGGFADHEGDARVGRFRRDAQRHKRHARQSDAQKPIDSQEHPPGLNASLS